MNNQYQKSTTAILQQISRTLIALFKQEIFPYNSTGSLYRAHVSKRPAISLTAVLSFRLTHRISALIISFPGGRGYILRTLLQSSFSHGSITASGLQVHTQTRDQDKDTQSTLSKVDTLIRTSSDCPP